MALIDIHVIAGERARILWGRHPAQVIRTSVHLSTPSLRSYNDRTCSSL